MVLVGLYIYTWHWNNKIDCWIQWYWLGSIYTHVSVRHWNNKIGCWIQWYWLGFLLTEGRGKQIRYSIIGEGSRLLDCEGVSHYSLKGWYQCVGEWSHGKIVGVYKTHWWVGVLSIHYRQSQEGDFTDFTVLSILKSRSGCESAGVSLRDLIGLSNSCGFHRSLDKYSDLQAIFVKNARSKYKIRNSQR